MHDEWDVTNSVRVTAGVRMDGYQVKTEATPGYEIDSLIEGAQPPINPATLPDINGETIDRTAVTGEAGLVLFGSRPVSVFAHYVRSYRHPNLEELLFAGPATAGSIVPNITVAPEKGHNVDVGTRFRFPLPDRLALVLQQHVRRLHLDRDRGGGRIRIEPGIDLPGHQSRQGPDPGRRARSQRAVRRRLPERAAVRQRLLHPRHGAGRHEPALRPVTGQQAAGQHHPVEDQWRPARERSAGALVERLQRARCRTRSPACRRCSTNHHS